MSEILVVPANKHALQYKVSLLEAKSIVNSGSGIWKGRKTVYLTPDRNERVSWNVRQSGYAGPLVLQVST